MRFKITFNRTGRQRMLPMDYQYYLSAWIYKVIGQADPEFSDFLHSQGYLNGHQTLKVSKTLRVWKRTNIKMK